MALTFGTYNSASKLWIDDDFNSLMSLLVANAGIIKSTDFVTTPNTGMILATTSGKAIINTSGTVESTIFRWFKSTATEYPTVAAADATNPRVDNVCLKIDLTTRQASVVSSGDDLLCKGNPDPTSPVAPAVPTNYYKLYEVRVNATVTSITADKLTDKRDLIVLNGIVPKFNIDADPTYMMSGLYRNFVLNGNFDVWVRQTTRNWAVTTGPVILAEGWQRYSDDGGAGTLPTITTSRQSYTVNEKPGSTYYHRVNTNGAGASLGATAQDIIYQKMPNAVRSLAALSSKVTVVFELRSSIANKKCGVRLYSDFGSGGSPSAIQEIGAYNAVVTTSNVWQKFSITFSMPSMTGKTFGTNNDDGIGIDFRWMYGSGVAAHAGDTVAETFQGAGNFDIGRVAVYPGDTELPYFPRTYMEELSLLFPLNHKYRAMAFRSGTQSTAAGTKQKVQLNAEVYDPNGDFDSSTDFRYTAPVSGYYRIVAKVGALAPARTLCAIYKNGSETARIADITASGEIGVSGAVTLFLSVGDYIEMFGYTQNATTFNSGANQNYLSIELAGF